MPLAPVFAGQGAVHSGSFAPNQVIVTLGNQGQAPAVLINAISFQFAQPSQVIFDIGNDGGANGGPPKSRSYTAIGRASGSGSLQRLLGMGQAMQAFLQTFSDICNIDNNTMQFGGKTGCVNGKQAEHRVVAKYCHLNSVGYSYSEGALAIQEACGFVFSDLSYDETV